MAGTILRLGWTNPQTGVFGAHPQLGAVIDLNDGVTFTLLDETLELAPPARELALSGNARTQGERASRALYRHNRIARAQVTLGPMASYSDLATTVRYLTRWLDAPPATPICLQWQPPSATSPVYLDIVGAAHALPADERDWLRLQVEPVELVFVVRPGLRGDRVTLSNLVSNPGFEAPSGPGVLVFSDAFANANAYAQLFGAAPSVAGNVLTLAQTSALRFGSPAWGAINQWTLRWQWKTGLTGYFYLHYTDANDWLGVQCEGTTLQLQQKVGGTTHILATVSAVLSSATWYWLGVVQFPAAPGTPPAVQAILYADSAGSPGALVANAGPVPTFDALTALAGQPALQANGATMAVGGNYPGVHAINLFGPGGWQMQSYGSGVASGAWEQNSANTFGGGAVASFGAARLDFAATAGTQDAAWLSWNSGSSPLGTAAMPAATGQTVNVSLWLRSSGLSASTSWSLRINETDVNGAFLRQTATTVASGNLGAWTQVSASATLGATTAYVYLSMRVTDATGGSAGGVAWLDNVQCWNVTTTGQASMPYCELRFPQSPAQLVVTGLVGDLPAPALVAWGTYLASWATGATLTYALGRRGRGDGTAAAARLVGGSHGYYGTAAPPQATAALDATSYGGYYPTVTLTGSGWNARAFSAAASDTLGGYHLLARFWTAEGAGNLANVQARVVTQQRSEAWWGETTQTDQLGATYGPYVAPISASATWTLADAGQVSIPPLPAGALTDLTQHFITPRPQWIDTTGGGATARCNGQLLLPIDGSLLMGLLNNPSNAPFSVTNAWLWVYHDGLLLNRSAIGDAAASTYSLETAPIPNPANGGGGPGTSSTGVINVNSGADPALILDPTLALAAISTASGNAASAAGGSGVNQLAGVVSDNVGTTLPLYAELQYSPLYLYPR